MKILRKAALGLGASAILLTSTAPAFAAVHRGDSASVLKASTEWNDWGRGRYRHRHRDRIDGGDVLTGIGILAGIAIIAGAASKADRSDRVPERYPENYPSDDGYNQGYSGDARGNEVSSAVESCSIAAESRGNDRVAEIRSVNRDGAGWRVEGDLSGGDGFTCGATNGQVDYIQVGNEY